MQLSKKTQSGHAYGKPINNEMQPQSFQTKTGVLHHTLLGSRHLKGGL